MELMEKRVKGNSRFQYPTYSSKIATDQNSHTGWHSSGPSQAKPYQVKDTQKLSLYSNNKPKIPDIKKISPTEMAKRREKGLCYNCDEVYVREHKCQKPQLFLMVGDEDSELDDEFALHPEHLTAVEDVTINTNVGDISIHALTGTHGIHTLKIDGPIKGRAINMLVDTGSTHNFLSNSLVKSLKLPTQTCTTMRVTLADGTQTSCTKKVEKLVWKTGKTEFISEFHTIPLGSYDAILGIQWLQ